MPIAEVKPVRSPNPDVVSLLERLLAEAKSGELISLAAAWENPAGYCGHEAAFGKWSSRTLIVGKLAVLQQHIVLNECLEWKPAT